MDDYTLQQEAALLAATDEALEKYRGDWDHYNNEPVGDWGFSDAERTAFIAGALFEHKRAGREEGPTCFFDGCGNWAMFFDAEGNPICEKCSESTGADRD